MRHLVLFLILVAAIGVQAQDLGFDMNTEVDEARGIATEGRSQSQGSLGDNSAEDTLGVESQGTTDSRSGHANYSQDLEGYVRCPSGEFGSESSIQQAWVQCRRNAGSSVTINYCEPTNSNDTAYSDCSNGEEYTTNANIGGIASSFVGSSAKIAVENCTAEDSDYFCGGGNAYKVILSRSGSFSGGEGQANAQGNDRLNNPSGPVANTQGSGVYDQDGKPMLSGTNPNSGTAAAEMISASQTSQCAKDVGVSLDQGEPVFTCGSDEEAGTFTSGEDGGCEETERCTAWEDEQVTRTETCTQSTNLSQPECRVQYPVRECQRSKVGDTETCSETTSVEVIAQGKTGKTIELTPHFIPRGEKYAYSPAGAIPAAGLAAEWISNNVGPSGTWYNSSGEPYGDHGSGLNNVDVELWDVEARISWDDTTVYTKEKTGCPSNYSLNNGKCYENINTTGFNKFKETNNHVFYKKETSSNSCGQYE